MFNLLKTVIHNSIKNQNVKTKLGRWSNVSCDQSKRRAIWSSIDHCGKCDDHLNMIELEWILDDKQIKEAHELTGTPKCTICGSIYHLTKDCPTLKQNEIGKSKDK
jgi:hypothetical protein